VTAYAAHINREHREHREQRIQANADKRALAKIDKVVSGVMAAIEESPSKSVFFKMPSPVLSI
jgi:hypothetical protein